MTAPNRVVIYDGSCGLCSRTVRFLKSRDRNRIFTLMPLHDVEHQTSVILGISGALNTNTVIYLNEGQIFQRSEAVIRILSDLGGFYKMSRLLLIIPRVVRDSVYQWVAKNRHRWFKQNQACEL